MKKCLKDIADFRAGYLFRGRVRHDPRGTVGIVQIKDIDANRRIMASSLDRVTIDKPDSYLIEPGDVLFLSRGHHFYATVVPAINEKTIATGYFVVLRPKEQMMLPGYLAWSLNQPDFEMRLRPYIQGTHMPTVSKENLRYIRIEIPPLEVQGRIVKLNELLEQERRFSAILQKKRGLLVQAVSRKMMLEPRT